MSGEFTVSGAGSGDRRRLLTAAADIGSWVLLGGPITALADNSWRSVLQGLAADHLGIGMLRHLHFDLLLALGIWTPVYFILLLLFRAAYRKEWKRRYSRHCLVFWLIYPALFVVGGPILAAQSDSYLHSMGCNVHELRDQGGVLEMVDSHCVIYNDKPVIYLYPQKPQPVSVRLHYRGKLTFTYPAYDEIIHGWDVTAQPSGEILKDGKTYPYLFWEGAAAYAVPYDLSRGFVVRGADPASFFARVLPKLGLTPKEYNEFIVYWHPRMMRNSYNFITFAGKEYTELAPLEISPAPDSLIRVMMLFKPLRAPVEIPPLPIVTPKRSGFTVVEWGGTELN